MALGLKRWVVLVFLLLVGVAAWGLLPPRVEVQVPRRLPAAPEYHRFAELQKELKVLSRLYQWGRRRELLVQELETVRTQGEAVVIGLPPEAPDSLFHRLNLVVERQLQGMGLAEPAVPIGVFILPDSFGSHPMGLSDLRRLSSDAEYYLAQGQDDPFCITAWFYPAGAEDDGASQRPPPLVREVVEMTQVPLNRRNVPNALGLCRFWARYGQPGSAMMDWLRAGASRFAEKPLGVDHFLHSDRGPARGPFGKPLPGPGALSVRELQCLAGDEDICADLVLGSRGRPERRVEEGMEAMGLPRGASMGFIADPPLVPVYFLFRPFFFSVTESEFGAVRFGEFWRSPLEPEEAFQEAFGEPMGPWIMGWLRRYVDPPSTGPGVPARAALLTFLTLGLLMGAAVRMGRK